MQTRRVDGRATVAATFLSGVLIFLSIFGWRVVGYIDLIQVISIPFFLYLIFFSPLRSSEPVVLIFSFLLLMFAYSVAVFLFSAANDPFVFLRVLRAALTFGGMLGLASFLVSRCSISPDTLLSIVVWCLLIHGLLMISMYIFRDVRVAVYALTGGVAFANTGTFLGVNFADLGVRVMGLTYGLSSTSLLQIITVFLLPVWLLKRKSFRPLWGALAITIIVSSSLLAGRSGVVIFGLLFVPFFVFLAFSSSIDFQARREIFLAAMVVAGIAVLVVPVLAAADSSQLEYTLFHLSELRALIEGRSQTMWALEQMWLLPESGTQLFFGAGSFGRAGGFYLQSDIGIIQYLFAYGILGTFVFLMPILLMLFYSIRFFRHQPLMSVSGVMVIVPYLMFLGKEEALYQRCAWSVQVLVWSALLLRVVADRRATQKQRSREGRTDSGRLRERFA